MNAFIFIRNIMTFGFITAILFYGCASTSVINLVKEQTVSIEKKSSKDGNVQGVTITQNGDVLTVSGKVLMRSKTVRGHVDIAVYSSDGILLKKMSTYANVKRMSRGRGTIAERTAHFSVEIPVVPSKGSVIRIGFHKPKFIHKNSFDCDNNVAI